MHGAIMFLNGTGLTIFRSLFFSEKTCLMVCVMECFIHNMPANEMTLIMEQEE